MPTGSPPGMHRTSWASNVLAAVAGGVGRRPPTLDDPHADLPYGMQPSPSKPNPPRGTWRLRLLWAWDSAALMISRRAELVAAFLCIVGERISLPLTARWA